MRTAFYGKQRDNKNKHICKSRETLNVQFKKKIVDVLCNTRSNQTDSTLDADVQLTTGGEQKNKDTSGQRKTSV